MYVVGGIEGGFKQVDVYDIKTISWGDLGDMRFPILVRLRRLRRDEFTPLEEG